MTRQRGYGAGGIRRRDNGSWELRWYGHDGKRRSKYLAASLTKREAQRALTAVLQGVDHGVPVGSSAQTVEGFAERWLTDVAAHQLRPKTLERYAGIVRLHIIPSLGSVRLDRLTADHVAKLHADCRAKTIKRTGEAMSAASIRSVHACLRSILRTAIERSLIATNPTDAVHPPRAAGKAMQALDAEQANLLLDAAKGDEHEALYVLALTTGMRLGELLGLRWQDIDLDGSRLSVQVSLIRTGKAWYLTEPKTEHSRRNIALPHRAVRALRGHSVAQKRLRLMAGEAWEQHGLVFTNQWGEPLNGAHVTERVFKPLLKRAGLPSIRFHDLRHTAATIMLLQGINPRLVAERLGHSGVAITLDRYSHVLPSMQAMVADKLDEVFGA